MNRKFIQYFNQELIFLKESGAEFAEVYPKVAGRLGLNAPEIADPYVERLLEGFAFLTSRVRLKIDAEYPRFAQRILQVVHPDFLLPLPVSSIARFYPSKNQAVSNYTIKRGTTLHTEKVLNQNEGCQFLSTQAVQIAPIRIQDVSLSDISTELPLAELNLNIKKGKPVSSLRIDFAIEYGSACSQLDLDDIIMYLNAEMHTASHLLYLIMEKAINIICHDTKDPQKWFSVLDQAPEHRGFDEDEALNFKTDHSVPSFRLMQEYNHLPQKFLFFAVKGVKQALKKAEESNLLITVPRQTKKIIADKGVDKEVVAYEERLFSLTFLFNTKVAELENTIDESHIALHCTPIVNLFKKKSIRFAVEQTQNEFHAVVDRTKPLNYEIQNIEKVTGYSKNNDYKINFHPIFSPTDEDMQGTNHNKQAFFSWRREPRIHSLKGNSQNPARTAYLGGEVFLSLTDAQNSPYSTNLDHLALEAWCTNRDLPMLLSFNKDTDFSWDGDLSINKVKLMMVPVRPVAGITDEHSLWKFINHIGINHLSIFNSDESLAAQSLKEFLDVYLIRGSDFLRNQIESIYQVKHQKASKIVRDGPAVSCIRGINIEVTVDEMRMTGVHPYLFGSILNHFFARLVSINSFSKLTLVSLQQGKLCEWPHMSGTREII